ncbi:hypothetical protein TNCV_3846271 [Trichonephila clavipes]|nr:hypothetical protein TNCV_3846271 [Trichonephila clavipes]
MKKSKPLEIGFLSETETFETLCMSRQKKTFTSLNKLLGEKDWDGVVTPDALSAFILRGFKSFPSLIMKFNTTTVSILALCQILWNPLGIVPEDWKLDAYLQLKPLRHARSWGKRIVTSLNELWGVVQNLTCHLEDGEGYVYFKTKKYFSSSKLPRQQT